MCQYKILTDSGSDLPPEMLQSLQVPCVPLSVLFRGETRDDCVDDSILEIYAGLRAGEVATTSAINPTGWKDKMKSILEEGNDILVIAFSSGLSTTYQSAVIAAEELRDEYPQRTILVSDSRCASLGQGLLVWYACQMRDKGLSLQELYDWVEETKFHLALWFTVDDLVYLKRGGRVSATTALLGTMLNIKPVLHMDDEGHLINMAKVRGRKAAIDALAAKLGDSGYDNETVFICHGDCIEDARYLEKTVKEKYGVKNVFIGYTGAVIGSHSGPGTLALFFLSNQR